MDNNDLRNQIRKELQDVAAKKNADIKTLEKTVSDEMFLRSTVTGGAFSGSARRACDARANAAHQKITALKASLTWQNEMLQKYK